MIRASLYLAAAGAVWGAEGYVFSRFLAFSAWQTGVMIALYAALFLMALFFLLRWSREITGSSDGIATWRLLSLAPMLVAVVGSFVSLPILLLITALGHLG